MANKTVTVSPSGGDYTTLALAIAGELSLNADLVTNEMLLTISIEGDWSGGADTSPVTVSGFTVNSSYFVRIICNAANRAGASWDADKYTLYTDSSADTIAITDAFTEIIGLQINNARSASPAHAVQMNEGCTVLSCGIKSTGDGITGGGGANDRACHIVNNIVFNSTGGRGIDIGNFAGHDCTVYNNIVLNANWNGIRVAEYQDNLLYNNYAANCTFDAINNNLAFVTHSNNFTDDGSLGTTVAFTTDNFTNVTAGSEDLTPTSGSDLIDAGVDLSSDTYYPFNTDMLGNSRTGTWDAGPIEYQGSAPERTVTYDDNGADSGTAPTDANSPYEDSATVTVLGNTGSLVRSGYTFEGWNTASDGSGTSYDPDDTFTITANVTLYAVWLSIYQYRTINQDNYDPTSYSNAQITAAAALKAYFEHASVGQDVVGNSNTNSSTGANFDSSGLCGLALLYADDNRYLCDRDTGYEESDYTWFQTHSGLQTNARGNPVDYDDKLTGFLAMPSALLGEVDIAMFKFCFIDTPDATYAAGLVSDIETLEASYPNVRFVYWTIPVSEPDTNANQHAYNEYIRNYCTTNGKWLLDIAAITSYDELGVHQLDGNGRELLADEYSADGGHLTALGRTKVAAGYWSLLAEIAKETTAGALSGVSAGTCELSATIHGIGALSGISEGSCTVTGTLSGGIPSSELSGIAIGTSQVSGTLTGTGALSGSADGTCTATATLIGLQTGALSGTAAGTCSIIGTLRDASQVIIGELTLTFNAAYPNITFEE